MAPGHSGEFWVGNTAQCPAIDVGLALGSLPICIKPADWNCLTHYLLPHTSAIPVHCRPLGSELCECTDDSRSSVDGCVK